MTANDIIEYFQMEQLPVEGTYYKSTYRAKQTYLNGPIGTAIIGLYSNEPLSLSRFHRLKYDETWHFYAGDPFQLYLLYPDGKTREVVIGNNILAGQKVQFTIPANVWQAGEIITNGKYALFGCTMTPGFSGNCFEGGTIETLLPLYPQKATIIKRLGIDDNTTTLPQGFTQ